MIPFRVSSAQPQTPFAPVWDYTIALSTCNDIDCASLSKLFLDKEREVKNLPVSIDNNGKFTDGYTGLGKNSTTSRFQHYNILTWNHPEIHKLKQNIISNLIEYNKIQEINLPKNVYIICWYNVLRFGQKIKPHLHTTDPHCYLSGHFNIQVKNTSTVYMSPVNQLVEPDVISSKNVEGEMTIFPSYIIHYTTPHYSFKPRITVAFDIKHYKVDENWIKLF